MANSFPSHCFNWQGLFHVPTLHSTKSLTYTHLFPSFCLLGDHQSIFIALKYHQENNITQLEKQKLSMFVNGLTSSQTTSQWENYSIHQRLNSNLQRKLDPTPLLLAATAEQNSPYCFLYHPSCYYYLFVYIIWSSS